MLILDPPWRAAEPPSARAAGLRVRAGALAAAVLAWLCFPAGAQLDAGAKGTARAAPQPSDPRPPGTGAGPLVVAVVRYHDAVRERDVLVQAIPQLLDYVATATHLEAQLAWEAQPLFDPRIQQALLLYLTGQDARLRLDTNEREALGEYLRAGGMLFAEDVVSGGTPQVPPAGGGIAGTPFDQQLKALIADPLVLGASGRQWLRVPPEHPLYHIFFAFPDGPPLAASYSGTAAALEMVERRGRVAVLFSDLNLSWFWANRDAQARERPLQMGVNILVQALAYRYAGLPPSPGR
jgi:hypothetical protein